MGSSGVVLDLMSAVVEFILPPFATQSGGAWYAGTADAVTQNIGYIEQNNPDYVLNFYDQF